MPRVALSLCTKSWRLAEDILSQLLVHMMLLCPSRAALRHALPMCASRQLPSELFYAIHEATSSLPRGCNGSRSFIIASSRRRFTTGSDESQPATRPQLAKAPYRILFAGADRFSCTSLELLAKQDKSMSTAYNVMSYRAISTENLITICLGTSGLVQELSVLVPPDKRTSRGLKQVHRREWTGENASQSLLNSVNHSLQLHYVS